MQSLAPVNRMRIRGGVALVDRGQLKPTKHRAASLTPDQRLVRGEGGKSGSTTHVRNAGI